MNIPLLNLIFKKKAPKLTKIDSIIVKKIKKLSLVKQIKIFKDAKIYHHKHIHTIPLLLLDTKRGVYIFEEKGWSYKELKDTKVKKKTSDALPNSSNETITLDKTKDIIINKFNELNCDDIKIYKYLLLENLTTQEYNSLDSSFKELLPKEKIIFSDTSEDEILTKLQNIPPSDTVIDKEKILTTLFAQYSILDDKEKFHLCTNDQIEFINKELTHLEILNGRSRSGKSLTILLKSMVELINNPKKKIIILKPTPLACDILKKRLLDIIEYAIIELDLTSIEIITPIDLLNRHRDKAKINFSDSLNVEEKLLKKRFDIADIIMCDDSDLYDGEFIHYLKHIQKKSSLLLVNSNLPYPKTNLQKSFHTKKDVDFIKTMPHPKAMHTITQLLEKGSKKILIVANELSVEKLMDDLKSYIKEPIYKLDSSLHLIDQNFENITFCTYKDTNSLTPEHTILMDLCFTSENEIKYAFNLAKKSVCVLYEDNCVEINKLREYDESNQE